MELEQLNRLVRLAIERKMDIAGAEGYLRDEAGLAIPGKDIESSYDAFEKWLLVLLKSEPMPKNINGLDFGLFDGENGRILLYATGSESWDESDSDWACDNDYFPNGRYAAIQLLGQMKKLARDGMTAYAGALVLVVCFIHTFVQGYKEKLLDKTKVLHIATGFNVGDLYNVICIKR